MRRLIFPISLIIIFSATLVYAVFFYRQASQIIENKSEFVNPLIGTDFHGHTHPSAMLPFGMVQLGPDTRLDGWDGCSAFHYSDSTIYGFSHTHLSGTGCSDYGDILLMPFSDFSSGIDSSIFKSSYKHSTVVASPGFYSVTLEENNVNVSLTVSSRVGFHKYLYTNADERYVLLDLKHRDELIETSLKQVSDTRFVGLRRSKAWAEDQILYFVADFSEPVSIVGYQSDLMYKKGGKLISADEYTQEADGELPFIYTGKNNRVVFKTVSGNNKELLIKVGLSATGEQGAIKNLEAEIPDWDFEKVKNNASTEWDKELSKIIVSGGRKEEQTVFYTALYHTFSAPNIYSDVDGSFRGTDLKVHKDPDHNTYTVFSLWDTYRATHPLYTLIQQKRTLDFIKTFLDHYRYGGMLPMWELSGNETYCMIGYHSVPVIVDAYFKGIKDFDLDLALKAMTATAKTDELGKSEFAEFGFIPLEKEHESVSKTLEYAFDDWCIAMFAKDLGKTNIYDEFIERSQFYKNIFNPENGFMQAKLNGAWQTPFDPREVNYNFTEANSWQYSFYVPHDIFTFIELHGGNEKFVKKLDLMFSEDSETLGNNQADITGLIGQYAHGNEPSHHMAYLYNYCGQPWKTQYMVRKIMAELYSSKPDGLCGNEDCGQMSAWYVMSALGIYPVNPANGIYDLGSPIFDTAVIQLENGRNFEIIAYNNTTQNVYVQSVKLNGKEHQKSFITHNTIMKGGKLEFFMGPKPNKSRGTEVESIYLSKITDNRITPVPFTNLPLRSFRNTVDLKLSCLDKDAEIFYSLKNDVEKNPIKYVKPIKIDADVIIEAYAISPEKKPSRIITAKLNHIPDNRSIKIISEYSPQYSAGGDNALIDFVKGEPWFRSGLWQGYTGQDFEAVVDLTEIKDVKLVNARFLQDIKSWIFFPVKVSFYASKDGITYVKIYESDSKMRDDDYTVNIQEFKMRPPGLKTRYIKIMAKSYGKLPNWHLSAGYDSWLFTDEIEIQ